MHLHEPTAVEYPRDDDYQAWAEARHYAGLPLDWAAYSRELAERQKPANKLAEIRAMIGCPEGAEVVAVALLWEYFREVDSALTGAPPRAGRAPSAR